MNYIHLFSSFWGHPIWHLAEGCHTNRHWHHWQGCLTTCIEKARLTGATSQLIVLTITSYNPHCAPQYGSNRAQEWSVYFVLNLSPRNKGRKLAWQGVLHENTMILRMRMLSNLLPVATCRRCPRRDLSHGQTACEPASRGVVKYEVSCDWRFQPPTLPFRFLWIFEFDHTMPISTLWIGSTAWGRNSYLWPLELNPSSTIAINRTLGSIISNTCSSQN